ncbi:MAG TPA: ubiquinone/menaquinone biosynthesis methyltransferase [Alphaproteobacteria bacterium]|nr:ubiquinone/menaquinone biosynthesis methyltransferase [Alphaproteobacteria bacterium]
MSASHMKDRIRAKIVTPDAKRSYVRGLFGRIAGRYDLTNDVISAGLHRRWKRLVVGLADVRPGHVVLDLAAGTGDLALRVARRRGAAGGGADPAGKADAGILIAGDLTMEMMRHGRTREGAEAVAWLGCDAMRLPLADGTVDRVLVGYGFRNFPDLERSIAEIRRVMRPGGRLVSLDFGRAEPAWLDRAYVRWLEASMSAVGWLLHRDVESYRYIPESLRTYPAQRGLTALMQRHGFARCGSIDLFFGTMAVNFGDVPE